MEHGEATNYLSSLLGQSLRVYTTDARMFVGTFKCTDSDRNIILASTFEYRPPSEQALREAAELSSSKSVKMDMTSRFLGLVVVPGEHIVKIEVEGSWNG